MWENRQNLLSQSLNLQMFTYIPSRLWGLHDWIQERNVLVQEDTYKSARTIHSKRTRHQAFQSEISSNKERLDKVQECGQALLKAKHEMSVRHTDAATIAQWKDSLNDAWADLGELIDTRNQMLEASRELHKYRHYLRQSLKWVNWCHQSLKISVTSLIN